MKSLTTLKLTSASSRAMRISRIARSRCSGDKRLSPRKSFRTFLSLSDNASNIGQSHGERSFSACKTKRIRTRRAGVTATIYGAGFTSECGKNCDGREREEGLPGESRSRAISHALVNRIYLINDQHGDRRVDKGVQNRVGDYGVVQRPRGETFKQQSDHDARAD